MALRVLGVALTVGEKGVALIVGENLSLKSPLCTRLEIDKIKIDFMILEVDRLISS